MENDTSNEPLLEARNPEPKPRKEGFLEKTGIYGLELAVAMITMVIVATVLSFGAFALSQFMYGTASLGVGQLALWSAASTIVWLPVVYIFYLRSGAYMERHPEMVNNNVQRAFVVIYQVVMLLTVIAFAFTAVYSMLNAFVQAQDMSRTLVTTSLPAFVSALIFGGAFIAFFRHPVVSRHVFATALLVTAIVIVVPVIIYSMVTLRGANMDSNLSNDLYRVQSSVSAYYRDNGSKLPDSLSDLPPATRDGLEGSLSDYDYSVKSSDEYELCATFATDTTHKTDRAVYNSYPSSTNDYYRHTSGKQCYNVNQQSYSDYYDLNKSSMDEPNTY